MSEQFDVFISHNSQNKPAVRELVEALKLRGLRPWLDEEQLRPGQPWQVALETIIQTTKAAAVLVGKDGLGPWENIEMRACLSQFVKRKLPVIPVLLPDAPSQPDLPLFLQELTWVDLRGGLTEENINLMHWGITGSNPAEPPKPTSAPRLFNVPIPRNPFFTGRDDVLAKLQQALHESHELVVKPSQRARALSGLGGVGKTQTVAEYAHRHQSEYAAVLWVLADGKDLLRGSFAQLSTLLGFKAEKQDDQILAVQSWLHHNDGWLLIFDNAETLELLTAAKNLLPTDAKGHVLFTTRAQATGALASVTVDCFDDDTGAVFLLRRSKIIDMGLATVETVRSHVPSDDWQTATTLVHELGGLALAIDQAGAYIEQTDCGLDGYLTRYRNNAVAMLKERGYVQSEEHSESVCKSILLALENAEKRHPLVGEIMRDSALLHPDGISEKLYFDIDPLELDKALATLKDYSLIQRMPEKKLFTMHHLTQIVIRDMCDG
jgi:hypothetical protein